MKGEALRTHPPTLFPSPHTPLSATPVFAYPCVEVSKTGGCAVPAYLNGPSQSGDRLVAAKSPVTAPTRCATARPNSAPHPPTRLVHLHRPPGWTPTLDLLQLDGNPRAHRFTNGNLLLDLAFKFSPALTYYPTKTAKAGTKGKAGIWVGVGPYKPGAFYACFQQHGAGATPLEAVLAANGVEEVSPYSASQ